MDQGYNGRWIFGLGGKGKLPRIPPFPQFPRNRPGLLHVLSEYVIDFALNLVFLAVAFRGFIIVLSIRFIRPPVLVPVSSCSVTFMSFLQLQAGYLICEAYQNLVKHLDVNLNWLNWFHFLIFLAIPLVILIGCMIFVSPFLVVIRISMSTVPFLAQLEPGILYPQCAFLWSKI